LGANLFRVIGVAAATLAMCFGLSGCGGESDADLVAAAKAARAKNDQAAAIIHLKSALQKNAQAGEARLLLGEALLSGGDATAAVVELEKARELRQPDNSVLPLLAKSFLATGQAKKVTDQFGKTVLTDPKAHAELMAALAAAYVSQGQIDRAKAAVDAALQADAKCVNARLLNIRLTAGRGAFDQALALVDVLAADDPKNPEPWNLKGELLWLAKSDLVASAKAFRQALDVSPRFVPAHVSLIRLSLQSHDDQGFIAQVERLKKLLPNHPETRFYDIQLALKQQDVKRAREGVQQLLRFAPDNANVLQLAGAVEFQGGALVEAETLFRKSLTLAPQLPLARRFLAETYLRLGQPNKALSALQPLLVQPKPDAEILSLAAQSYLLAGDHGKAESLFNLAAHADPGNARARVALALAQVEKGNIAAGFAQLDALASTDSSAFADLALISALARKNELDAALKAVDRLQSKLPGKPLPSQIRAQILLQRKDVAGARASLENALVADASFLPAAVLLADLDVSERKPKAALDRYMAVLGRDPKNPTALLAVAVLKQQLGATPEEVSHLLAEAVKANPGEVGTRVAQVDQLLLRRQPKAALTAAQDAASATRDDPRILDALARAHMANGDTQQAIGMLRKVVSLQPLQPLSHIRLADALVIVKDYPAAEQSLRKALEIDPSLVVARRSLIRIALADKKTDEALRIARAVQKQRPADSIGFVLEAEIHVAQRAWAPAIRAMRSAIAVGATTELAVRLHALYVAAGKSEDAELFAVEWLKRKPKDAGFMFYLGDLAMDRRDYPAAERRYREVLGVTPDNASALNNVAWLLVTQNKPGAVPFAERAAGLASGNAAVLDTLARAYEFESRWSEAIKVQLKAAEQASDTPSYRLSLAKLFIKAGDPGSARRELQVLVALGGKFSGQAEVANLLKSLP